MKPIFDKSWTLFLDRDGVINTEIRQDYVKKWEDFHFETGALEALARLNQVFGSIVIVTNQRGVGIGVMSQADLDEIHEKMLRQIQQSGGRIDRIYAACPPDRDHSDRKPNPTMAYWAKRDFPEIDFSKSVIIGNSTSDMEFGRAVGMYTVYIDEKQKYHGEKTELMDVIYDNLRAFTLTI